jgi:excisionase family DNA binding protein
MEKLLNTRQAASLIGVHPLTLKRLATRGVISYYRWGGRK